MTTYLHPGLDRSHQGEQSLLHPVRSRGPGPGGAATGGGGRLVVDRLPALASHRGSPPDLVVRWGTLPRSGPVDVVVHLHGFSGRREAMTLPSDVEAVSGLDLADPEQPGTRGRTTPTVLVLPRGHYHGGGSGKGYSFPALQRPGAVTDLVEESLRRVGQRTGTTLRRRRLILTAHSGGGAALMAILRHTDPDEVFAYDALYNDPGPLIAWARRRQTSGSGAMRVIYRAGEGTAGNSARVAAAVPRSARFRVEPTTVPHGAIPRRFGWRLLADAGADLPGISAPGGRPGGRVPPAPPPGGALAEALVRVANREFSRWRPGGGAALTETSPAASPILREYYRDGVGATVTDAQMRSTAYQSGHPWSAVFISYVVEKAGGGDRFSKSAAHQGYIRAARENRLRARVDNPFWAYRADEIAPQPGDIVCAARSNSGATYDNIGDSTHRATHCDVVVERRPGSVRVIGGNVGNTVGAKTLRLRPDGKLDLTGNQSTLFAVIRCGGSAPSGRLTGPPPSPRPGRSLEERVRRVMHLLTTQHGYPVASAAGVVGNLMAESQVIPNRIEGSREATPMRAQDFSGTVRDFTPEEVRDRDFASRRGPRLPGVGLAQWTSRARREGLFRHTYRGARPGAAILDDLDAQVDYLVSELRQSYRQVDAVLRRAGTTVDQASDVVLLRFEIPAAVLNKPVNDPGVQRVLGERRALAARALRIFRASAPSGPLRP